MQGGANCAGSRSPRASGSGAAASTEPKRRAIGFIPAAGRSRRFGGDKLTAEIQGRPLILQVASAFLQASTVHAVFVVTHAPRTDLLRLLEPHGVRVLLLPSPTPDMRATVEQGMRQLESLAQLAPDDVLLITPADVVGITPRLVDKLVLESYQDPGAICVPVVKGRRAHPLLLPWSKRAVVYALPPGRGLNALLTGDTIRVHEVRIDGGGQVDIDTPLDLEVLRRDGFDLGAR